VNSVPDNPIELLPSPWASAFYALVSLAQKELLVASPFLSSKPLERIIEIVKNRAIVNSLHIQVVTNFAVDSMLSGSLDVSALLRLAQSIPNSTVTYLPGLHAKIYIADSEAAVVTSANLTNNGLAGNHEYGVLLRDANLVSRVKDDLTKYASLGNTVSLGTLEALSSAASDLKAVRKQVDRSIGAKLKAAFEQRTEEARLELLKARAKGKTTHGILCDTILYLLEQRGPLSTVELNILVQQIHPDLCDDAINLVIDGVHFGKKWKHYVRTSQVGLKRRGLIERDGRYWKLRR
jgi:phosphatidylserine/phosphatidylglycerophosphate/cardiolipin synthase-like enzyme